MEGGEFAGSARWGAEGAEKQEVRENRLLTRWGWGITGSAFDAETRRGGERRGEETGGMEGGEFAGSARWGAEGAEKQEVRENRLLTRWGWGITGSAFDAETRRGGERRGEETGGMEGGEFAGSARWGAEGAEKQEVRENRLLTRWGWGITGSAFDAETRRRGERRGEETGGMEGGEFAGSARWGAEGAEKEEVRENRLLTRWGWGTAGSAFDAEARRRGERRGEETGGMEGGEFTSSARWGAEGAEKEEVRENRSLTRWGWGITGSAFDAETRRGGERRG